MLLEIIIGPLMTALVTIFLKVLEKPERREARDDLKIRDDLKDLIALLKEVIKEERVMRRQALTLYPRQLCFLANNIQALKDEITSIFDGSKISSPSQGPRPEQTISEQPGQSSIATMISNVSKKPENRDHLEDFSALLKKADRSIKEEPVMRRPAPTPHPNPLANVFESLAESSDFDSGLLRLVANNIGDHKDEITSISNGSKIS